VVHFKYQIEEINNSKKIRETINYIYDNGKEAAPSYTNSIQFVQSGEIDLVTNIRKLNDWTPSTSSFSAVKSPLIMAILPITNKLTNNLLLQVVRI